jgi:hypothetical protein
MNCLMTVFTNDFSNFSPFPVMLVLGHPEHLSFSNNSQPALKRECHYKNAVWPKE